MPALRSRRWWSAALTLSERARIARDARHPVAEPTTPPSLHRWRKQRPFDRADILARRIRIDGLTETEFASLVAAPPDLDIDHRPGWIDTLDLANGMAPEIDRLRSGNSVDAADGLELARAFAEPFLTVAMSQLFARARAIKQQHTDAPFDPEIATRLFESALWNQLASRALKVVILELNVARVQGTLSGDTAAERCADFVRQLRVGEARDRLIEEYPVLVRSLVTAAEYWEQAAAEFLENLATDAPLLAATFLADGPIGELDAVVAGAGDGHRHGRSVIVARMSRGFRIVYKPRPLEVDLLFADLIDWLNARGMAPALRAVKSISVGDHGWSEFVAATPCTDVEGVGRFYERFGALLAVLHALEATDFHYENVIAWGEFPALIDLEALFHPRTGAESDVTEPESLGWRALQHSVLRAGVLPFRIHGSESATGIDLSAVGGRGGQLSPSRFPVLVGEGTDEMRFAREFVRLPDTQNRPALGDTPVDPTPYAQRVVAGFSAAYRLLVQHRGELTAVDGPLHRFATVPIRVVLRPTRQYALILSESHHPDVLRDAIDRDRLFDKLWIAIPSRPEFERIVAYEHADLVNGDVPLFTTRPGSRDLFTTHGAVIDSFFDRSGLESALDRIASMGDEDLLRQLWVVEASLVGLAPGRHGSDQGDRVTATGEGKAPDGQTSHAPTAPAPRTACDADFIDAANGVGHRLARLALRDTQHTTWLGLNLARDRDWVIQPLSAELYNGSLGIAFFLAYLDDIVPNETARDLARAVVAQVIRRVESLVDSLDEGRELPSASLGAFGLFGGTVYGLAHIGALWNDHALLELGDRVAAALTPRIEHDRELDIVSGAAGFAMAAAALHHVMPSGNALAAVTAAADRIASCARPMPNGAGWTTSLAATQPLTGASHGASGMSLALVTAAALLRRPELADLALAATRYERDTYDAARLNWPDYRILDEQNVPTSPAFMWAWCHGAPGVGLARLALLAHTASDEARADLDLAMRSTASYGFGTNDSLCHGDLGNLELFVRARELGHRGAWEESLATESGRLLERLRRGEWRCGIPGGVETPGFMMGLAGIGYGLLRLAAPARVPSVLSLEGVGSPGTELEFAL